MSAGGCSRAHDQGVGYCDLCGLMLGGASPPVAACPGCGATGGGGFFCERCGHPLADLAPPVPRSRASGAWYAIVTVDSRLFAATRADAHGFVLPDVAERRLPLTVDHVRIGRSGRSTPTPEIDLGGPPPDPGVSREHAQLLRHPDGSWAVRDSGSANGIVVGTRHLTRGEVVPVGSGDRILLGIWSRITLVLGG